MKYVQQVDNLKNIKLDKKDKHILSKLAENARTSLSQIAKEVGLSRDAISYRIKNYEKIGIIQGYRTIVNMNCFDYESYHLFVKINNPVKSTEEKLINSLKNLNFIRAIIKFNGKYDFEIAFVAQNLQELDINLTQIINQCHEYIQDYELLIISKTLQANIFPKNFCDYKEKLKTIKRTNKKIDKKDIQILKIISENAKMPLYEIAYQTKQSIDTVSYRIKNLDKTGVIIKFIPVINYAALGYNMQAILLNINNLNEKNENKLKNFLIKNKNTLWAVKTIGKYNVLIYILDTNINNLQDTILNLRTEFPNQITQHEILTAYEEYKYTYFPINLF